MPDPIAWKSKIILAKVEDTYGTDPALAGSADAILMTNVVLTPMDGEDISRDLELPYLGAQASLAAGLRVRLTGRIELAPSGTAGVPPAWGALMRGLGCAETIVEDTSVTYNPVTSGHESLYFKLWIGPTLHEFRGARGTARLRCTAQAIPVLEIDFQGLFLAPVEAARPVASLSRFRAPQIVSSANTNLFSIGGVPLVLRELVLDLGNQVEPRLLVGRESILIADRAETLSARVEAVPLSVYDPYLRAVDGDARVEVQLRHGTGAGRITTLIIPSAQQKRLSGFENSQNILEWPLSLTPLPIAGNDQWRIVLS